MLRLGPPVEMPVLPSTFYFLLFKATANLLGLGTILRSKGVHHGKVHEQPYDARRDNEARASRSDGKAAQADPVVKPYRSFLNLAEGKVFCVMEAPSKEALAAWFSKMQMPCDNITPVELEGERGSVHEA